MNKEDFIWKISPKLNTYISKYGYKTETPSKELLDIINEYKEGKYGNPDSKVLNIFSELEPYFNGSKRDTIGSIEDERDMLLGIKNNLSEILKGDNLEKLFDKDADNKVEKKEIKQVVKEEMTPEEKAKIKSDIEEAVTNEDINAEFREPTGMYNIPAATTQIFSNNRKKENLGTAVQKKLDEKMRQIMGN